MKKNRIVVFNRLTSHDELADVSTFEDLVGNHYDKFCYLYEIVSEGDFIDNVKDIKCKISDNRIRFVITLTKECTKKIIHELDESIRDNSLGDLYIKLKKENRHEIVLSVSDTDDVFFE